MMALRRDADLHIYLWYYLVDKVLDISTSAGRAHLLGTFALYWS